MAAAHQDPPAGLPRYARDRLTWLVLTMTAVFGFAVGALGPAMPLMRDDLDMSRTVGGLHFTLVAVGGVVLGFFADRVTRRLGRRALLWAAGGGVAVGALAIGVAPAPFVSLFGAAVAGAFGAALLVTGQSTMSDIHAAHRGVALTEANTAMSVGILAPAMVIAGFVAIGVGWRAAFAVPMVGFVLLVATRRSEPFPDFGVAGFARGRLPGEYWWFWAAMVPAVAAEWAVGAWGAGYLVDVGGASEGLASLLLTSFFATMIVGRIFTARLAGALAPLPLLLGASALGLAGVLTFWLSEAIAVIVAGFLVAGLGISAMFPMLLTLAVDTASARAETAAARASIAAGLAVLVSPVTLGFIADQSSLRSAFAVVPGLFLVIAVLAAAGNRAVAKESVPAPP